MTHLSPQISHLVAARPMSVTMGNAIRQLKLEISGSDIDLPEQDVRILPLLLLVLLYCTLLIIYILSPLVLGERRVMREDRSVPQ